MSTRAIRWIVGALVAVSAAAIAAACSLDEGETSTGLDGGPGLDAAGIDVISDGGTTPDVVSDVADVFIPATCATIDASCLGTAMPDGGWSVLADGGWSLLGVASGDAGCPSADFTLVTSLVENPRLVPGSCTCAACIPQGNYTCPSITMNFGATCNTSTITKQVSSPCVAKTETTGDVGASAIPLTVANGLGCTIAPMGMGQATTDPLTGCSPNKCATDFCGLNVKGFKRCIVHANAVACPNGFNPSNANGGNAGTSVAATCAGCPACTTPDAGCTGNIRIFNGSQACDGDGGTNGADYKGTFAADGGCDNTAGLRFDSFFYVPDPTPTVTCAPAAPTTVDGGAGLLQIRTICCVP